jgi:FKBP-type peptidyl-prolyl cis-trans isomerase SlyD
MKVGNSMVVEIHYTLKNDAGEVLDSSEGRDPLAYLHGAQNIVEGLEDALDELEVDAEFEVVVPPKTGYGERDDRLIGEVPKENFPEDVEVEVGMQFVSETPEGPRPIYVKEIKDEVIVVDGNHELAGQNLHFSGKVVSIREATPDECSHGHAHSGDCGHDH